MATRAPTITRIMPGARLIATVAMTVAKNVVKTYSVFLADGTVPEFLKVRVVEAASGPAAPPAAPPATEHAPLEL